MMQFSTTEVESKKFCDVETPWDGPSSKQGKKHQHQKQISRHDPTPNHWNYFDKEWNTHPHHVIFQGRLGVIPRWYLNPTPRMPAIVTTRITTFFEDNPNLHIFLRLESLVGGRVYIFISYQSDIENYTPWKLTNDIGTSPFANRKYIDSFMVDFPASHVSFRVGYLDVPGS